MLMLLNETGDFGLQCNGQHPLSSQPYHLFQVEFAVHHLWDSNVFYLHALCSFFFDKVALAALSGY